ncbi:DHA2 family efflux MFS transporter permease subunit [Ruicaihuangia caeni]|uniref:DHA2 family efflux MFS transporter permease subunit n=1 Tax=Ruicaihuangia caeni TaxID=3042517 RepID=UPI00338FBEC0
MNAAHKNSPSASASATTPDSATGVTAVSSAEALGRRNRLVIWLLLASSFVVILNETIMSVAIPELMIDLEVDARAAQWLSTAFMLTMATVIPITGFLLQRFNTRPIFIAAMSLFSLGTLAAALAPGFAVLVAARVVQASGTAIMMPLLMTTLMTLVPPGARGRTMGNVSIVISVAPAIGPTVSGVILNSLGWRWIFIIVLPIALGMLALGAKRIANVTEPKQVPIDLLSVMLSALGFGGLIYGLSRIGESSAQPADAAASATQMWATIAVGVIALVLFVWRQLRLQRRDRALLDLRTFRSTNFSVTVALMVIAMASLFGALILLPIYLRQALELEPLMIGLLLLPGGLLMGLLAPFVGRLYDRFGPTPLLVPGTAMASAALWMLSATGPGASAYFVLGAHLVLSAGLALIFTPLFTSAMASVAPSLYSHASAIVGTVQQVAGAAGTALFVTVMSIQQQASQARGAVETVAVAEGVQLAFFAAAVLFTLTIIAAAFVRRPQEHPHPTDAEAPVSAAAA